MEAILKFNLPEENADFKNAIDGVKYKIILFELDQYLRNKLKYENIESIKIEDVRQYLDDMCCQKEVSLYD